MIAALHSCAQESVFFWHTMQTQRHMLVCLFGMCSLKNVFSQRHMHVYPCRMCSCVLAAQRSRLTEKQNILDTCTRGRVHAGVPKRGVSKTGKGVPEAFFDDLLHDGIQGSFLLGSKVFHE